MIIDYIDYIYRNIDIDANECWNWKLFCDPDEYGKVGIRHVPQRASRFAYSIFKGKLKKNLLVLHHCDNRKCINPDHLYLGTAQDNANDLVSRNRQANQFGERNPNFKVPDQIIKEIRTMYKTEVHTQKQIAQYFNLDFRYINAIIRNKKRVDIVPKKVYNKSI